jgi:hypothetical protein
VKSCPKCLNDLEKARAESLGLSSSFPSAQLINHHSFRFKSDANLASKRSVEVMLLLYWSNPVSQVLRAMAVKRTTRGRSNFGELMTVKIS